MSVIVILVGDISDLWITLFTVRPRIALHLNLSDYNKEYNCFKAVLFLLFIV